MPQPIVLLPILFGPTLVFACNAYAVCRCFDTRAGIDADSTPATQAACDAVNRAQPNRLPAYMHTFDDKETGGFHNGETSCVTPDKEPWAFNNCAFRELCNTNAGLPADSHVFKDDCWGGPDTAG